jgi:hypothetical protein
MMPRTDSIELANLEYGRASGRLISVRQEDEITWGAFERGRAAFCHEVCLCFDSAMLKFALALDQTWRVSSVLSALGRLFPAEIRADVDAFLAADLAL